MIVDSRQADILKLFLRVIAVASIHVQCNWWNFILMPASLYIVFLALRLPSTHRFSRMLVVYVSRAQLDRSQASASAQKGVKEEPKEHGGDHAFPITHVRAAVRKARRLARACRVYGKTRAWMGAYVLTHRYGVRARCVLAAINERTRGNLRALRTLPVGADTLVRPRIAPQALYSFMFLPLRP